MHFDELVAFRATLKEFTQLQGASLMDFYDATESRFNVVVGTASAPSSKKVRHLTSTMTCIESLSEMPSVQLDAPVGGEVPGVMRDLTDELVSKFLDLALDNPQNWDSDGAAHVYCRVRTLGPASRMIAADYELTDERSESLEKLLEYAWASHEDSPIYGLREAAGQETNPVFDDSGHAAVIAKLTGSPDDRTYPPNAFLTYWGLVALANLHARSAKLDALNKSHFVPALMWLDLSIGQQVTFHYERSPHADPQQLLWALCALVRFSSEDLSAKTSTAYASLSAGLKAFFEQQNKRGEWKVGNPLFHYPNVGNAYCYIFETLGELLSLANAPIPNSKVLRDALEPYAGNLRSAFLAAEHSAQRLPDGGLGWSSGHHPHRLKPESWATASVFRFAQGARRLVGHWTSDRSQALLGARRPLEDAATLRQRGGTWNVGTGSAGAVLSTCFVNPILRAQSAGGGHASMGPDPDATVIPTHGSRSAILFGPPGTGKTTLVRAVAGALDWPFIEITPAQFLDQGVEFVSKRADEIFRQVMELDRCVVLLDEIDELIQTRDDRAEPLERFFTTSMLPRLANLWEAGRILFFANTNDIVHVDPAIRRSQRFDSALFILPPGWEYKTGKMRSAGIGTRLTEEEVNKAILDGDGLAWLALLRYDQVGRLVEALVASGQGGDETPEPVITSALKQFKEELLQLDWRVNADGEKDVAEMLKPLLDAQRRDHSVRPVAQATAAVRDDREAAAALGIDERGFIVMPPGTEDPAAWVAGKGPYRLLDDGSVELAPQQ